MSNRPNDVSQLSPDARRELLAQMLAARTNGGDALSPCSYNQRSLWFMHQLAPHSTAYHVSASWRARAAIDVGALERAFDALVARHEALRTTFESRDGEPWQRVHERIPSGFRVRDLTGCDDATLLATVRAAGREPFDLESGPILRATLFTRSATDHVLLISMHHITCDLWSIELIVDDLRQLYGREIGAVDPATPMRPAGAYRDFTTWQRRMLSGAEGEAHWQYWRTKLQGHLTRLEMPTDRPRPPVESFARGTHQFAVPADLMADVRRRAAAERTTPFTFFLAAFQCLIARYSGQEDILVGSASSGRSHRAFETMVGYFVNTIVFRGDLSDDPPFRDVLQRTREDSLATLEHQDFPFPLLVERLRVPRDASRAPICDVDIVWDKTRDNEGWLTAEPSEGHAHLRMDWFGVPLETYPLDQVGAPSDLGFVVFEIGQTISVGIGYGSDLFDKSTVARLGQHFLTVLRAVAVDPELRLSRLPIATPEERDELLREATRPLPASDADRPLHVRFAEIARAWPDNIAAVGASGSLTYRDLDMRAEAVAARLSALGVGRGAIVGLRVERDIELAVSILGVLKSGAAYLPIDAAYPDARVAFMLRDSSAAVLLTQRALADALTDVSIPRIFVDDLASTSSDTSRAHLDDSAANRAASTDATVDDLAYVIYTSGSTGQPKGVMVTHRNVGRLFDSTAPWFEFNERDVWSLFHSAAFDVSVWELWGALLHGGRVVIVPYAITRSPEDLLDLLAKEHVTILSQTPSAFRQLIAADVARDDVTPLDVRFIVLAGEALDVNALRPWFDRRGDDRAKVINMYGITETTVHSTFRRITATDLGQRVRSPIGVPIPDLRLLVLDAGGEPVPVGVPGELYVGGAGVTRGYLSRPELTAARFLRDPGSSDPNARLYRSGDLARRLANGDIEYLGRIDQQVKVRGYRIELGEIEMAIANHPAVAQCAAIVRADPAGDGRIIAYVVLREGHDPSSAELQTHVRRSLPDYMVPSAFVRLNALPLTSNHKLDARALPVPDQIESASTRPYVPPRSDVERAIVAEWQRVLGVSRIGVDDDFFELGGHSILATGLARWMRAHFEMEFPVYAVFESPTVAGLARHVDMLTAAQSREEFEL